MFLVGIWVVPVRESRGRAVLAFQHPLLVPVSGLFSAALAVLAQSAPGLGGFSLLCFYGSWAQLSPGVVVPG